MHVYAKVQKQIVLYNVYHIYITQQAITASAIGNLLYNYCCVELGQSEVLCVIMQLSVMLLMAFLCLFNWAAFIIPLVILVECMKYDLRLWKAMMQRAVYNYSFSLNYRISFTKREHFLEKVSWGKKSLVVENCWKVSKYFFKNRFEN